MTALGTAAGLTLSAFTGERNGTTDPQRVTRECIA